MPATNEVAFSGRARQARLLRHRHQEPTISPLSSTRIKSSRAARERTELMPSKTRTMKERTVSIYTEAIVRGVTRGRILKAKSRVPSITRRLQSLAKVAFLKLKFSLRTVSRAATSMSSTTKVIRPTAPRTPRSITSNFILQVTITKISFIRHKKLKVLKPCFSTNLISNKISNSLSSRITKSIVHSSHNTTINRIAAWLIRNNRCNSKPTIRWRHRGSTVPNLITAEAPKLIHTALTTRKRSNRRSLETVKSQQVDAVEPQAPTFITSHRRRRIPTTSPVKTLAQACNSHKARLLSVFSSNNNSHRPSRLTPISSVSLSAKCPRVKMHQECKSLIHLLWHI